MGNSDGTARVSLLEDNAGSVYAFRSDNPQVWHFGQVTPDMYGKFAEDAQAWVDGDWEPSENDGQHEAGPDCSGLDHVADYEAGSVRTLQDRDTHPVAWLYIAGPEN